jgi:hypothetical protein
MKAAIPDVSKIFMGDVSVNETPSCNETIIWPTSVMSMTGDVKFADPFLQEPVTSHKYFV